MQPKKQKRARPGFDTGDEVAIKELVTAKEYTHFRINSLAMFARRQQMVFASATAWYRIVREFNLRRPGVGNYPPKLKIGIRALEPNQIWSWSRARQTPHGVVYTFLKLLLLGDYQP
jgi:hypothetical protein